jgi:hypothetical protein
VDHIRAVHFPRPVRALFALLFFFLSSYVELIIAEVTIRKEFSMDYSQGILHLLLFPEALGQGGKEYSMALLKSVVWAIDGLGIGFVSSK